MGRARQLIAEAKAEEARKESTPESAGSDSDAHVGPKSQFSLLDQHSRLKKEAEGTIKLLV